MFGTEFIRDKVKRDPKGMFYNTKKYTKRDKVCYLKGSLWEKERKTLSSLTKSNRYTPNKILFYITCKSWESKPGKS